MVLLCVHLCSHPPQHTSTRAALSRYRPLGCLIFIKSISAASVSVVLRRFCPLTKSILIDPNWLSRTHIDSHSDSRSRSPQNTLALKITYERNRVTITTNKSCSLQNLDIMRLCTINYTSKSRAAICNYRRVVFFWICAVNATRTLVDQEVPFNIKTVETNQKRQNKEWPM